MLQQCKYLEGGKEGGNIQFGIPLGTAGRGGIPGIAMCGRPTLICLDTVEVRVVARLQKRNKKRKRKKRKQKRSLLTCDVSSGVISIPDYEPGCFCLLHDWLASSLKTKENREKRKRKKKKNREEIEKKSKFKCTGRTQRER